MNFPYTVPERDLHFNVALALIVLHHLAETDRGRPLLNVERLTLFVFLLKNPLIAAKLLSLSGHSAFTVDAPEGFSVRSLAPSWDELLNYRDVKILLRYLGARKMLCAKYRKGEGAMLALTELGTKSAQALQAPYFRRAHERATLLAKLNSVATKTLYQHVYDLMRAK